MSVKLTDNGDVVVAWIGQANDQTAHAARYTNAWSTTVSSPAIPGDSVNMAMGINGHTVVAYPEGGNYKYLRFDGTAWQAPVVLHTDDEFPMLGVDAAGHILTAWCEGTSSIRVRRFDGTAWIPAPDQPGNAIVTGENLQMVGVHVPPSGIGRVIWSLSDAPYTLRGREFK